MIFKRIKVIFLFLLLYSFELLFCLDIKLYSDASLIALGENSLIAESPSTSLYQPAMQGNAISVSHSNPYGFNELNFVQFAYQKQIENIGVNAGVFYYENKIINYKNIYAGFSYNFLDILNGINLRYLTQNINNYDKKDTFILDYGLIKKSDFLSYGFSFSNITQAQIDNIKLNSTIKFENMIRVNENVDLATSFEKEKYFDYRYSFATKIRIFKNNFAMFSFINNPEQFATGVDFNINKSSFVYAVRTHPQLDLTHSVSIIYYF